MASTFSRTRSNPVTCSPASARLPRLDAREQRGLGIHGSRHGGGLTKPATILQEMKAVILAGGEGTRLRPLTLSLPKPVVPVVDRPFLHHQLDLLATVGVREIVFSVAYRPERMQGVFGDGAAVGCGSHDAGE